MPESEVPNVLVLGPITPSTESVRADQLTYEKLVPAVEKYQPSENARQEKFWASEPDSLDERAAGQQLASQYMLMGAFKLNEEAANPKAKQLWSERYTRATSELYGVPDQALARTLFSAQLAELSSQITKPTVDRELVNTFAAIRDGFGIETASDSKEAVFVETASELGALLNKRFGPVFEALELEGAPAKINPDGIAEKFERALKVLVDVYDSAWSEWTVERRDDKDQLSIVAGDKQILVGMNRASVTPTQLKGLIGHELLVHAQRAVNGSKKSKELGLGLPGYLDAEEGLGVFFEYALTGDIPQKNIDRYVDIALALGQVDGRPLNRMQLLEFAMVREQIRNQAKPVAERQQVDDIEKAVYAHVNRIYRGSLGNEYIGVFTKDIAYHKGFVDMGNFIAGELAEGKKPTQIVTFLLKGKFDPTNPKHLELL